MIAQVICSCDFAFEGGGRGSPLLALSRSSRHSERVKVQTRFVTSAAAPAQFPAPSAPEIAFLGRSNVGKSSLINALVGDKIAKTSNTPGRTQTINFFELRRPGQSSSRVLLRRSSRLWIRARAQGHHHVVVGIHRSLPRIAAFPRALLVVGGYFDSAAAVRHPASRVVAPP